MIVSWLQIMEVPIQIWSNSQDCNDQTIRTVAEAGFKMILSNYEATYLDCG